MTKSDCKAMFAYFNTHPEEISDYIIQFLTQPNVRERIKAALDESESVMDLASKEGAAGWLTAQEVGQRIGQSSRWVRDRLKLLPADCIQQRGKKSTWYINYPKVSNQLFDMRK